MKLLRKMMAAALAAGLFASVIFGGGRTDRGPEPSVHIRSAEANRQEDGTYQVKVDFTTDVFEEAMTVTVFCGEESRSLSLAREAAGEVHSLAFEVPEQPEEIRAELGDPEGVQLRADAAAPVDGDRKLILQGASVGAVYEMFLVVELWELLSCPLALCPDPEEATVPPESPGAILKTDSDGTASLNLTKAGLPDGLYLLTGEGEARYVCLPRVDASGELLGSTVTVIAAPET